MYVHILLAVRPGPTRTNGMDTRARVRARAGYVSIIIGVVFLLVCSKLLLGTRNLVLEELPVLERGSSVRR